MGWLELTLLGTALGFDAMSLGLGIGVGGPSRRRIAQLVLAFGATAGFLLMLGYMIAIAFQHLLHALPLPEASPHGIGDVLAFEGHMDIIGSLLGAAIFFALGVHLLWSWWVGPEPTRTPLAFRGPWGLVSLAGAVSIDAFSVGVGLGMLQRAHVVEAVLVVAVVNGAMSLAGLGLGRRLHQTAGRYLQPLGGIVMLAVAISLLAEVIL